MYKRCQRESRQFLRYLKNVSAKCQSDSIEVFKRHPTVSVLH